MKRKRISLYRGLERFKSLGHSAGFGRSRLYYDLDYGLSIIPDFLLHRSRQ
jgi:hypothetical protein